MMPVVTVPPNSPNGLPIAIAASPTSRESLSPNVAGDKPVALIFKTAKSVCESEPIISAEYS